MAPKFGTSGLRGLVSELTETVIDDYIHAFMASCTTGGIVWVGHDLRPSSPGIAQIVAQAARRAGATVIMAGALPTPALALAAHGAGAVMVTGSHIPADRNGLKFYTQNGEISKSDEATIIAALGSARSEIAEGIWRHDTQAADRFGLRYVSAFGRDALVGRRIGVYSHSAVARDLLLNTLQQLGAETIELARSDVFIPVDTEAVDPATRTQLAAWVHDHRLDAIASTDGDSDRPMLTDETGRVIPGDILGQITAELLGADCVVTPISSNSGVTQKPQFQRVIRTRIGSPFVIAAMEAETGRVAGYEANGGFLLGFTAQTEGGPLAPLLTRDSFLPLIAPLIAARGGPLSARVAQEPPCFTAADRLQDMPMEKMHALVTAMELQSEMRALFLAALGAKEQALDLTDGIRMTTTDSRILHIRPSGNAPELRLYVEQNTREGADANLAQGLAWLRSYFAAA